METRKKRYQGQCHCGHVQFEIDAEIDHVRICDCSICHQRGALIFRVAPDDFRLKTDIEELSTYRWGTLTAVDYFCPKCGILPFRKPSALTKSEIEHGKEEFHGWAINTRCLRGFNPSDVPAAEIKGSKL